MRRIAAESGPQAVAFSQSSPSTTAIGDAGPFIQRLMNAFGTPNWIMALELCGWGRAYATRYTYGVGSVATGGSGGAMADIANSGCLILWGYNPSVSRLTHATATVEALKRGMKLIVIDPRAAGLANKADIWLRVRPGTDGALALGLANIMIERNWYDQDFMRQWTNGPLLVRADNGRLLRASELRPGGNASHYVAWSALDQCPALYDSASGRYECVGNNLALTGQYRITTNAGVVECSPVFEHYSALCRKYSPQRVKDICWIEENQLEETARLIWHSRPVSYYAWSGHEQHANATETARAMAMLYALTGSFDAPGGNVLLPAIPSASISGEDLPAARDMAPAIGFAERPLGPARWRSVAALDFYRAVLDGKPYPVRGLIGFGTNLLLAQSDTARAREALSALDFFVHADLFMTPTAALADIVLPIASCFERQALKIGFEISAEAQSLVQFRQAVVPPPGEARSDAEFIFDLADRLGFGEEFWNGDVKAAYRRQLAPSGITLEELRAQPSGITVALKSEYQKHMGIDAHGNPKGFATPSRKIELWSETFLDHGYSALPDFVEPRIGPATRPDLAQRYPLVLTCAKPSVFCQSQHRALPSLRKRAQYPEVELHPQTAAERGIEAGAWIDVETPAGGMRARARFNDKLDPRVVIGEHGWWQACLELGLPGYDLYSREGSNFNFTVDAAIRDPVSGTPEHRANLCEVRPV
jgi:anaerobic selenocysteine-containing dehydrogenase